MKKFSGVARVTSFAGDLGKLGKTTAQSSIRKVNDLSIAAGKEAASRLKNVGAVIKERAREVPTKLANGAIGAGRVADETITNTKNVLSNLMPGPELAFAGGAVKQTATNTHAVEKTVKDMLSKIEGVNIGGKGTGNTSMAATDVTKDGSHFLDEFKLKPNMKYETNGYLYKTDDLGRVERASGELKLEMGERNGKHQLAAGGEDRVKAPSTQGDHGGHLIGTQFNGSPLIDNIVAMNGNVNVSAYKKLEYAWAKALRDKRKVIVDIRSVYEGNSIRPVSFNIKYRIDGEKFKTNLKNVYGGE